MVCQKGSDGMGGAHPTREREALITGDELARMPNHDLCELIDGRIVPMSPTNPEHGRIELNIGSVLRQFTRAHNLGNVMTGEVGIFTRRNPDRVRAADVAFITHRRYTNRTKSRGFLDVAPELVVDPDAKTIADYCVDGRISRYGVGEFVPCDDVLNGFALPVVAAFE
jgi:hypothetical protein